MYLGIQVVVLVVVEINILKKLRRKQGYTTVNLKLLEQKVK